MRMHTCKDINRAGFTLVELMITLAVSTIIVGALYSAYILQQRSYVNQGVVTELQQNIRVGIDFLTLDLRMAGYDPLAQGVGGITAATSNTISFTADMDKDGVIGTPATQNEYFSYALTTYNQNGKIIPTLCRSATVDVTPQCQPMADYIERIEFFYHYEDGTASTTTPAAGTLDNIRSVQVTLLARAAVADNKYTNTEPYVTASGVSWPDPANPAATFNDGFRRRLLTTRIDLRNMGI